VNHIYPLANQVTVMAGQALGMAKFLEFLGNKCVFGRFGNTFAEVCAMQNQLEN